MSLYKIFIQMITLKPTSQNFEYFRLRGQLGGGGGVNGLLAWEGGGDKWVVGVVGGGLVVPAGRDEKEFKTSQNDLFTLDNNGGWLITMHKKLCVF